MNNNINQRNFNNNFDEINKEIDNLLSESKKGRFWRVFAETLMHHDKNIELYSDILNKLEMITSKEIKNREFANIGGDVQDSLLEFLREVRDTISQIKT